MTEYAQPGSASGGSLDLHTVKGSLLLIEVVTQEPHIPTEYTLPGEKSPAIRANISVVDGPHAGLRAEDVLLFGKVLQSQLRDNIGAKVVGRIGQGKAKPGRNAPWVLEGASAEELQTVAAFEAKQRTNGYSSPASSSAEPPF